MNKKILLTILFISLQILSFKSLSVDITGGQVAYTAFMTAKYKISQDNYNAWILNRLFSGYVNMKDEKGLIDRSYLYYLSKYQGTSTNPPTIIELASHTNEFSLTYGSGPFKFDTYDSLTATENKYSWDKLGNVIYIDQPAGYGFSEKRDKSQQNNYNNGIYMVQVIKKILSQYKLSSSNVYLIGETYAGTYVLNVAYAIHEYNEKQKSDADQIQMKGFTVGNPCTDPDFECDITSGDSSFFFNDINVQFWYTKRFISDADYSDYQQVCQPQNNQITAYTSKCKTIINKFYAQLGGKDQFNFLNIHEKCGKDQVQSSTAIQCINMKSLYNFFSDEHIQKAFNIIKDGETAKTFSVRTLDTDVQFQKTNGSLWIYPKLLVNKYNVLVMSGMQDSFIPTIGTRKWISKVIDQTNLDLLTGRTSFQDDNNETIGFIQQYLQQSSAGDITQKTFTFVELLRSGHFTFYFYPQDSFKALQTWLNSQ